jgi:hypothetical protein
VLADEAQPLNRRALAGLVDGSVGPEGQPGQEVLDVDGLPRVGLDGDGDLVGEVERV